jgi:hypothetical protein
MLSIQEKLKQVPWQDLHHAYGTAQDTPTWLLALLSDQDEQREQALNKLWASICHQGSVYEASCAAVPFLIEMLAEVPDQRKPEILSLLDGLAHVSWYANKDQRSLAMNRSRRSKHTGYQWRSWGEFLVSGNEYHDPQWMHQAHQLVGEGISSYLTLLQSPDKDVVRATLDLLAGFQEQNALLVPVIVLLAFEKTETAVQVAALHCLGALLEQHSSYWEDYQRLAQAPDMLPEVRFAAAYTLAWHHPSGASPATVEILLVSVLPSQSCYRLKEVCKVLSHLGKPHGFRGLIDALSHGAEYWSILDTIRVAEALLDVAFFDGWVQNRYWHRSTGNPLRTRQAFSSDDNEANAEDLAEHEGDDSANEEELHNDEDNEKACFKWDYSTGSALGDFAITSFGYDKEETQRLQDLFMQEGLQALSDEQRLAIEALLRCEPLWKVKHNLLAIYALPLAKHELETFLAGK